MDAKFEELKELKNQALDELEKERKNLDAVRNVIELLGVYKIEVPSEIFMLEGCEEVVIQSLEDTLRRMDETRDKLVRGCNHSWTYTGHDSHHDWYQCVHCGEEKRD